MKKYEFKHISAVTASMILLETKTDSFENPLLNVVGALNSFTNTKKEKCSSMNQGDHSLIQV